MPSDIPWENVGPEHRVARARAGMVVDLRRCVGCHACSVACKTEHDVPLGDFRMRVRYHERPDAATIAFVPMLCMHCEDAPCLEACPTEAIARLEDGRVVIDKERCTGNKACQSACPYGAIYIDAETNVAEKCDFCTHRTEVGLDPSCVTACPTSALLFGDLDDEDDPAAKAAAAHGARPFKEEAGTRPTVLYVSHERFMEEKANVGVQLSKDDADIVYEQR